MPPDLNLGGPMPLIFQRYYASRLQSDGFISGRLGVNWLHNFEMSLTTPASGLVQVVTQFGRVIQFTNTGGAFSLVGRLDVPYQLAAGGSGYILGDPGSQRLYTFSSNGLLTQIADDHGNAQTLSYSGDLLTSVTDGLGRTMSLQYDSTKQLTNVTDGSRSASFMQTGSFLTSSSDALGNTTTYTYDMANPVSGLLTAAILPNGNAPFTQSYNTNGQVVIQVAAGAFPGTNTLSYEAGVTTITDPFGNQTRQSNSAAGLLTTAVDEAGFAAQLGYNAFGQRTAVTNRLGQVTLTTYHAPSGKVSSITYPDGSVWNFTYTNRIVSGITFYDLAQIDYADGTTDDFTYDNNGNLISYTDRAGEVWSFTYDAHGQKLTTTDPADGVATLAYNSDETLAARQDSDVGLITFAYDQFRRLTTITLPDNSQAESARLKMG